MTEEFLRGQESNMEIVLPDDTDMAAYRADWVTPGTKVRVKNIRYVWSGKGWWEKVATVFIDWDQVELWPDGSATINANPDINIYYNSLSIVFLHKGHTQVETGITLTRDFVANKWVISASERITVPLDTDLTKWRPRWLKSGSIVSVGVDGAELWWDINTGWTGVPAYEAKPQPDAWQKYESELKKNMKAALGWADNPKTEGLNPQRLRRLKNRRVALDVAGRALNIDLFELANVLTDTPDDASLSEADMAAIDASMESVAGAVVVLAEHLEHWLNRPLDELQERAKTARLIESSDYERLKSCIGHTVTVRNERAPSHSKYGVTVGEMCSVSIEDLKDIRFSVRPIGSEHEVIFWASSQITVERL